jgi:uncharacterized membrane-anchored protein YhcB (DUF1043 family)
MSEGDWVLLAVGLLMGIPIGAALLWFLTQRTAPQSYQSSPQQVCSNEEKWTWTDYKGRRREIVVKREARALV